MEDASKNLGMATPGKTRAARPDEVNYALVQDMGEGFQRDCVSISALETTFDMIYGEWVPPGEGGKEQGEYPVVICIHGTPATEGAFRPIGSRIAAGGYRVLAVNFPGMGYTKLDLGGHYDFTATHKAELVKAFIHKMGVTRVVMLIGHSTGGQVVGRLSADPELEGVVQSACFLCSTGIKPYSSQRYTQLVPYLPYLVYKAVYLPIVGPVLKYLISKMVYSFGFRARTPEAQVISIYEGYQIRFDLFTKDLARMAERLFPTLLLYTLDDKVVEADSIVDTIAVLDIPERDIKDYDANGLCTHTFHASTLRRVVRFATGTHRLQFKKPEQTTQEILAFLDTLQR